MIARLEPSNTAAMGQAKDLIAMIDKDARK
jgi:hypothetical protein